MYEYWNCSDQIVKSCHLWTVLDTRFRKFSKRRAKLAKNSLIGKLSFITSLVKINKIIREVQNVAIMKIGPSDNSWYRLDTFYAFQSTLRIESVKNIEHKLDTIEQILFDKCEKTISRAHSLPSTEEYDGLDGRVAITNYESEKSNKRRPMIEIKQEEKRRAYELKRSREEVEMLPNCMFILKNAKVYHP